MESVHEVGEKDRGKLLEKWEEALVCQVLGKNSRAGSLSPCRCGLSFGNFRRPAWPRGEAIEHTVPA